MNDLEKVIKQARDKYGAKHVLVKSKEYDFVCTRCNIGYLLISKDKTMKEECFGWKDKLYKDITKLTTSSYSNG